MSDQINIGDHVKLIGVPAWLLNDLPIDEQQEIVSFIGRETIVTDIDKFGYYWVGFGATTEVGDSASYSGHSFCVTPEYLAKAESGTAGG
jgi:hypothetical protein